MATNSGAGSTPANAQTGSAQIVPAISAPPSKSWWQGGNERDERKQIEKDGSQSHNVRRLAAYGGVVIAAVLYLAGIGAIALFLGLIPSNGRVDSAMWHIVVAVLVALFTVPTVLLIAILKVTSPSQASELPTTAHEALGKMVEKVIDKICD